ncbi:hypothetical protein AKJ16_DCAP03066 [Drosera capensis]
MRQGQSPLGMEDCIDDRIRSRPCSCTGRVKPYLRCGIGEGIDDLTRLGISSPSSDQCQENKKFTFGVCKRGLLLKARYTRAPTSSKQEERLLAFNLQASHSELDIRGGIKLSRKSAEISSKLRMHIKLLRHPFQYITETLKHLLKSMQCTGYQQGYSTCYGHNNKRYLSVL